ncbi:MAG: Coenzyme F420 hydrogenase/dehydrogenase, beta subunit C-terminal domain [Candidatus Helarchaeota archaeon]|nr:Coenzyme F420 hydrogenase/dehydrogenase, beta subunit C-terminal domain [Candidatus Helarchaeota archaeon]
MTEVKTFKDLENEIIKPEICSLCGGCVSICAINNINAIKISNGKPKFIKSDEKICLDCGLCYHICPRTASLDKQLEEVYTYKDSIGAYSKLIWTQTSDPEILKVCQDGGIITSLVKYLLDTKQVDGAIVNVAKSNWESFPMIVTSGEQLLKSAGTRYSITPQLEIFQYPKIYSSSDQVEDVDMPSIVELLELSEFDYARLAFVGCPCHVRTIRKMQIRNIRPATTIKYIIGLFCMENFTYTALMKEMLEKKLKLNLKDIKKVNIKKNFIITLKDNSIKEIPFKEVEEAARSNCFFCADFSNIYADISVGGIAAPQNHSTVLVRTEQGKNLFLKALNEGYLIEYKASAEKISKLKNRTIKIINRMSNTKIERASKNLNAVRGSG